MSTWSPESYLHFGDERTRPSIDLCARIRVDAPATVIDLGCGPGNSTQVLRERWPDAHVSGLDSAAEMIAAARESYPEGDWALGSIEEWEPENPIDVVFSNAALQWAPAHAQLVPRLFAQVARGGALAFQIPSDAYAPVRAFIHEIAEDPAWSSRMDGARAALTMEPPHVYYDVLAPLARSVDLWETEYQHVMDSPGAIVEWISSTGLRPFLDALDSDAEKERFRGMLMRRVVEEYPQRTDGRVLFGFRRLFAIAYA
jgi:trans-aconitate 2-methyltransferase